ncbi:MAG: MoxR family ATPase [Oscillospiraceae bacterium]|nr:MoxR family ATPase [Oscillospiraceae bacterium]
MDTENLYTRGIAVNYINAILDEVKKAVSGKDQALIWIMTAIIAKGHILLEDMPGVGKTTAALAFSKALGLSYGRVQFTPDVLPSDITGYSVYRKETGVMQYQPGAVLCNLFLADELNRATSRTQSALLEAMEEGQVTVDGVSHKLPEPFIVIATQNPTGAAGTQLLPDSQMDRFTIRLSLGYPDPKAEREMVMNRLSGNPLDDVRRIVTGEQLMEMQKAASAVYIKGEIIDYIVSLSGATRNSPLIARGASPRATLALTNMSKAVAYVQGRDYVVPKDVVTVFDRVVGHRLLLSSAAESRGLTAKAVMEEIRKNTRQPKV